MEDNKRIKVIFIVLGILSVLSGLLYMYARVFAKANALGLPLTPEAAKSIAIRSGMSLLAIFMCAILMGLISLVFQTITENRILTPGMIGFDSVFIATQAVLVYVASKWAAADTFFNNPYLNFFTSAFIMIIISMTMYKMVLRRNKNNIVFLLLFGLILSGIVRSLSNYVEVYLNPQEFQKLQAATVVSITNMNATIIYVVLIPVIVIAVLIYRQSKEYDVMLLTESNARSLGVPYIKQVNRNLFYISFAMAIITAFVGPLTFLGLLAVNIARELFRTYKHRVLLAGSAIIAVLFLGLGQGIVELLGYATPVTVLIDLVGGVYLIYLILRENRI